MLTNTDAKIMREAGSEGRVTIDLRLPEHYVARHFFKIRKRFAAGFVVAFSPRVLAAGVEILNGYGKGLAVIIGPFWICFAVARIERPTS